MTLAEGGPYRLPFGQPGINAKTGAISNANSLWIQYFYSYLNDSGRACAGHEHHTQQAEDDRTRIAEDRCIDSHRSTDPGECGAQNCIRKRQATGQSQRCVAMRVAGRTQQDGNDGQHTWRKRRQDAG